uniref:Rabphilin n=1 Tax=Globodera rostochiensis TaxID=31243 RepID=A0A914GYD0_GLORO
MATNLSRKQGHCNFRADGGDDSAEPAASGLAGVNSSPPSPGPVQIAYEYERHCCHWTAVASTSTIATALCPHQRRFCSVSSPSLLRSSFRIPPNSATNNRRHPADFLSSSHCQFLAVPAIAIQRIHRRMSAYGSAEMGRGGADKRKKKHPQLLRLTGQRAQSCTDFSNRLASSALPPSSLAAAALSAKHIHESGWDSSELFAPFQPIPPSLCSVSGSAPASASATDSASTNIFKNKEMAAKCLNSHRPLHSSDSGSCSAPPSLSPERKTSSARLRSSRFCCSFRRTLKRTPKRERCGDKKESVASMAHPSPEESQLLARAWSRKESRTLILPDGPRAGNRRERVDSCGAGSVAEGGERSRESSTFSLRRLSKAFFQEKDDQRIVREGRQTKGKAMAKRDPAKLNIRKEFLDLMNDWEIGGTPNPWVCPSDRHLQLRAQLKSGWSVRTANARSPTTSKQALINGGISEAEQAQIQKVLERAEAGRQNEQQRICKMIERLERLRARATGNGVTQCLLCQTEFGLLAAKSYAAMCSDCRKYVCQRNCGVETFDQKRREPIFLCKICSEYREMWKKSGAWFYREVPLPPSSSRPASAMAGSITMMVNGGPASYLPLSPSARSNPPLGSQTGPMARRHFDFGGGHQPRTDGRSEQHHQQQRNRAPVPIPMEQQQRLKTTPRPRIIPSWVHDGLQQSSVSVDDDSDGESASSSTSSSLEPAQFRKSLVAAKERALSVKQHAAAHAFGGHASGASGGVRTNKTKHGGAGALVHLGTQKLQRVALGRAGRMSDTDSENERGGYCDDAVSRRSSPSTSPRHSLATPSSFGGDDIGQNAQNGAIGATRGSDGTGACGEQTLSDSRSVDSGVVQSDHSAQQQATADGLVAYAHSQFIAAPSPHDQPFFQQRLPAQTPSPVPPPIPPRSATIAATPPKAVLSNTASPYHTHFPYPPSRRPASAAATPSATSMIKLKGSSGGNHSGSSHESIPARVGGAASRGMGSGGMHGHGEHAPMTAATSSASLAPEVFGDSRRSTQSTAPPTKEERAELEQTAEGLEEELDNNNSPDSPTFMNSPEDDSKHLRTLSSRRDAFASLRPISSNSASSPTRAPCHKTQSLGTSCQSQQQQRRRYPMLMHPSVSVESAQSDESTDDPQHIAISRNNGTELHYSPHLALTTPKRPHSANSLPTIDENSGTLGSIQFNLTYLVAEKQLIIHLIRAQNLKAMDKNGFSDPYVKFHLLPGNIKATKLTSRTIEKTLNPEWNEEMIYYGITEEERQRKSLRVTVLDRDRIGSDFLGETRVALNKLPLGQTKKFNLYLEHAMPIPAHEKGFAGTNKDTGSLFVIIKRCAELLGMDSTGFSDPYCKVSLTPLATKAHRLRTTIKKRTLNPEFNEVLQFIVPFKDLPRKTLVIGVYDYDVGRHDDYIGGIVLSTAAPGERGRQWQQVIENPGKTFEHWHRLEVDD